MFFQIPSAVYVWTQEWCSFPDEAQSLRQNYIYSHSRFERKKCSGVVTRDPKRTNASWTNKGGSMSITMCIIETCREEQVSDREGSHPQCRFSLEQTWWSLCCNSPTDFHKERCGQKLWVMVGNITRSRDRRASCYLKSVSRIIKMSRTRKNFRLRLICWIILVSGRYFAIVTSEQKSTLLHA